MTTIQLHKPRQPKMPTAAWTPLRHHPTQAKLWTCQARTVKVTAGRISGKTTLSRRRIVSYLPVRKPWPDPRYFYALPTYGQARRVAWEQINALIPNHWVQKRSDATMFIRTVFGSTLWVVGLDSPERIEGSEWDGGVIDESSDQKPGVFTRSIAPALGSRKGWCWRIGAPKRNGIGGSEFKKAFEEGLLDGSSFTWPSWDIIDAEENEKLKREMDPKDYAEQIGGNFQDAGGSAYYSYSRQRNVRKCDWKPNEQMLVFSDFNVDPMAWCLAHFTEDGSGLEVFDELWLRDSHTKATLDVLWERYGKAHKGGFTFVGDPAGRQRHSNAATTDYRLILNDERFSGRVRYDKSHPAVKDRLAAVNRLLYDAVGGTRLWVDERCVRLIDDFENRALKPDGTPTEARPGHIHDSGHMSDALGYGVWKFFPIVVEERLAEAASKLVVIGG